MSEGSKPSVQEALWSTLSVREQDEITRRFGEQSWSMVDAADNKKRVKVIQKAIMDLAVILHTTCPTSNREFSFAITSLEEVKHWATDAIEHN